MIAKWKILFETLHGFIQTFDFGALGDAFARATMAAINNIDWPQAAADLVSGAAGLIEALAHWIDGLDWQQIGSTIAERHRRRRRENLPKRQPPARQIWTVP